MKRFTLVKMYERGYCNGDIDIIIQKKMGTLSKKNGNTVLLIDDILAVDAFFNERVSSRR
jgi:hypothetical protein